MYKVKPTVWVSTNPMGVLSVSTPLFLEDENISQKSGSMVAILMQFRVQPWRTIFELHLQKKGFFSWGFSIKLVGAGKLSVLDFPIQLVILHSLYKTCDFQMSITLSKNLV
jgi:hypothetical protein